MKKKFEEWRKLTLEPKATPANTVTASMRVIDLPGFQTLEDKLLLYMPTRGEMSPELGLLINDLSKQTFGVTENDTRFEDPPGYNNLPEWSKERWKVDDRYYAHEKQFETTDQVDEVAVEILLKLSLDFRGAQGAPLRCTKFFARQAEAAAKGIMGKIPDRVAVDLDLWEKALERDARQYKDRKRSANG